jgi:hypothetical protein
MPATCQRSALLAHVGLHASLYLHNTPNPVSAQHTDEAKDFLALCCYLVRTYQTHRGTLGFHFLLFHGSSIRHGSTACALSPSSPHSTALLLQGCRDPIIRPSFSPSSSAAFTTCTVAELVADAAGTALFALAVAVSAQPHWHHWRVHG